MATFGADAVILDLEDAVPDAEKVATRELARRALPRMGGRGLVCVRVNGLHTSLTAGDVAGVVAPGLGAIVLPKTECAEHVHALHALLDEAEARAAIPAGHVRILPLVETARGIVRGAEIAAASPRVLTLLFGSGDFTRDLELPSVRWSADGLELLYARTRLVVDARAAGGSAADRRAVPRRARRRRLRGGLPRRAQDRVPGKALHPSRRRWRRRTSSSRPIRKKSCSAGAWSRSSRRPWRAGRRRSPSTACSSTIRSPRRRRRIAELADALTARDSARRPA